MSVALSTAAIATATAANLAARRASCDNLMSTYSAQGASVEQMQAYASCVSLLHPDSMSPDLLIFFKLLVVVLLLAPVIGAFVNRKYEALESAMIWLGVAFAAELALLLFLLAVAFLFS